MLELTPPSEIDKHTPLARTLFMDDSVTSDGSDVELIFKDSNRLVCKQALRFEFKISNNEVEYEILLL